MQQLYDRVLKERLPHDWAGAEWWCQVYNTPGKGLSFHWDKDEHVMASDGAMVHPALSSVLYLNSAAECASPALGATMVMAQRFDAAAGCGMPEPSRHDVLAWPSHNALLVFDGALAHGVLDSASRAVRRTLLVNWWRSQPRKVARASAEQYATVHCLAPAPPLSDADRADAAPPATRVRIPVLELRGAVDCADGPAQLSDVLAAHASGHPHAPAVALHHPDTVIWQVEAQDDAAGEAHGGEAAAGVHTPLVAALIPDALAAAAGSGSDSGSDSESCSSSSASSSSGDDGS